MSFRLAGFAVNGRRRARGILLLAVVAGPPALHAQSLKYPVAPREEVVDDYHGTKIPDPYRWLEELDSPRSVEWLRAEKMLTERHLANLPDREAIRQRLTSLWSYDWTGVPWREAGSLFYRKSVGLQPQAILYREQDDGSVPQTVLDPNEISSDGSIAIQEYAISPDGARLAYLRSTGGEALGETRVRDLSTGRDLSDVIHGTLTSPCWTRDGRGFFYVLRPEARPGESATASRPAKQVLYHSLGRPVSRDRLIRTWSRDARWV